MSWVSAYGVRNDMEWAIQIQRVTVKAASAASEPSQSVSFRSIDAVSVKPERKCTVTIVQQIRPIRQRNRLFRLVVRDAYESTNCTPGHTGRTGCCASGASFQR